MKRCLSALSNWFKRPQQSSTPAYVTAGGSVGRFVFNRRRDFFADGRPKPKTFQPERHPVTGAFETSVCGLTGVSDSRVWLLGRTIRAQAGLSAVAQLVLPVKRIRAAGLECSAAPEQQYDEHGVIVGWNNDESAKSERLALQQELVAGVLAEGTVRWAPEL
jgi:hypothetical protein